jgi:hypothetical protein
MNKILLLFLTALILLSLLNTASAVNVTMNADKTISIDGKKTFLIGVHSMCTDAYAASNLDCADAVTLFNASMWDLAPTGSSYTINEKIPHYGTIGTLFTQQARLSNNATISGSDGFFGYRQPDEPRHGYFPFENQTQEQMEANLSSWYNAKKYSVTGHPVILNICCSWAGGSGFDLTSAQNYADIVMWDFYGFNDGAWVTYNKSTEGMYGWETYTQQNALGTTADIDELNKPVFTYIQATILEPGLTIEIDKIRARSSTYLAIAAGVRGIQYYAYLVGGNWADAETSVGVYRNQTLAADYNEIIIEVRSLNDILVLPTYDHSWLNHESSNVTFSESIYKEIHVYPNMTNWAWIEKRDGNKTYLIIVNKAVESLQDVEITVNNLTGTRLVRMLGDETTGSASQHKTEPLTMINGVFTDSFDSFATHIYEISLPGSVPTFTVNSSNFASFTQDNVTEDMGDHNIKIGIFADNFNDETEQWTETGTGSFSVSGGKYTQSNVSSTMVYSYQPTNFTRTDALMKITKTTDGASSSNLGIISRFVNTSNLYLGYSRNTTTDVSKIRVFVGGATNDTSIDKATATLNTEYFYRLRTYDNNIKFKFWQGSQTEPDWDVTTTNTSLTSGYSGVSSDTVTYTIDDVIITNVDSSGNRVNSGYLTTWFNSSSGNGTYKIDVNATTPANTNYSVYYRQNNTENYTSLMEQNLLSANNVTDQYTNDGDINTGVYGNGSWYYHDYNTINANFTNNISVSINAYGYDFDVLNIDFYNYSSGAWDDIMYGGFYPQKWIDFMPTIHHFYPLKVRVQTINNAYLYEIKASMSGNSSFILPINYQNTDVRVQLFGNETATPKLMQITYYGQASSSESESTPWITGIGGQFFQNQTIGSNRTCINTGDGSIGVGYVCDNFNDNNLNGWNETGDTNTNWVINNGTINQTSASVSGYLYQNVTSYQNMSIFTKFKEYNNLNTYIDASDLRGNLSRLNANPSWLSCQFSIGSSTSIRAYIYCYNGSSWLPVNETATKTRYLNEWNYAGFFANGTTFKGYHSNISYSNAMTSVLSSGTSSQWLNGTTIQFGAGMNVSAILSWDEIRAVELDAQGNQYLQGNYTLNHTVSGGLYAKNITIDSTIPSGTNYSVEYRQNATGNYVAVGGVQTNPSVTLELPMPYYNTIDLRLNLNATTSGTLWINTITIGSSQITGITTHNCDPYYCQVQSGSTIQVSNDTIYQQDAITYTNTSTLVVPANISGTYNISYEYRSGADLPIVEMKLVITGLDVSGGNAASTSATWSTKTVPFINKYLNTTDSIIIQAYSANGDEQAQVRNFRLKYDYVPAPTILSPVNNSAQTSRIVNISWNGTAPFQYQVSQQQDFSTLLYNTTISNNYSGNLTFPTGLNYIKVRGYNTTENSVTNWSNIQNIIIYDSLYQIGGTGYNWSANGTLINISINPNNNSLWIPTISDYISYWKANNNGNDENATSGNTATLSGGATYNTSGKHDSAWNITNSTSIITVSDNSSLNVSAGNGFSFSTWIYPRTSTSARIFEKVSDYDAIFYQGNTTVILWLASGTCQYNTIIPSTYGSWHYVVGTYNSSDGTYKIYIDGVNQSLSVTGACTGTVTHTTNPLYIGNRASLDRYFDGLIDEMKLYSRAITQEEVTQLYNEYIMGNYNLNQINTSLEFIGYKYNISVFAINELQSPIANILYKGTNLENISVVFNLSNSSTLTDATFYIADVNISSPIYSQISSTWHHIAGSNIIHSSYWQSNSTWNLSGYIFSYDNGNGTFVNDSYVYSNPQFMNGWINVSKTTNSTIGSTIRWKVYANDVLDNWNVTDEQSYVPQQYAVYDLNNGAYISSDWENGSINSNTLQFNINGGHEYLYWGDGTPFDTGIELLSNITFTTNTNKTITNINMVWQNDTINFTVVGTNGYLNYSATMKNAAQNFSYSVNNVENGSNFLSGLINIATVNYTGGWGTLNISTFYNETRTMQIPDENVPFDTFSTYSPATFYDDTRQKYVMYYNKNKNENDMWGDRIYYSYLLDNNLLGGNWSTPLMVINFSGVEDGEGRLIADPSVVIINDTYYIYYSGRNLNYTPYPNYGNTVRHAVSTDGINWTKKGEVNISGLPIESYTYDGSYGMGEPSVLYEGGIFKLYFYSSNMTPNIVLATGTDGYNFTYYGGVGVNGLNPEIRKFGNKYILLSTDNFLRLGYWTSSSSFVFSSGEYVRFFSTGKNGTPDERHIGTASILPVEQVMYYGGTNYTFTSSWMDNSQIFGVRIHLDFLLPPPPELSGFAPPTPVTSGLSSQRFNVSFINAVQNITWYINGTQVQQNLSINSASYTNLSVVAGYYIVNATACNTEGCATQSWDWTVDGTPPDSVTNIQNTTTTTSVNWTWTDPADIDFDHVEVYVNNSWITNVSAGIQYYLNTSFLPNTQYTISTRTVDTVGNVNQTWVNQTTITGNPASFTKTTWMWWE